MRFDVLIVGAGHGGAQAATALRNRKFAGTVGIIGDEPELPYERPPLSKEYLSGDKTFERLLIRPADFWAQKDIAILTSRRVATVHPQAHTVSLADGETVGYGALIWAAGGAPRLLQCDGANLAGIHSVRTRADVDAILADLDATRQVVVVGGGYIGLEAAAVLTKLGKSVTVLEALDRVLARVAGEPLSRFYEAEHRAHGVDVRLSTQMSGFAGEDGRVTGVRLASGEVIAAQQVIVGIGIIANVEPLLAAGADGGDGVLIDALCRTTLPDIYAIGDCAAHENPFCGGALMRVESVQNANDQAMTAVKAITGEPESFHAVPWFWSNQYDLKLQTVGLSVGHDAVVIRGDPATRAFSVIYLKDGLVIALDCVNAVRDYVQGRRLVVEGIAADTVLLADADTPLKEIAA